MQTPRKCQSKKEKQKFPPKTNEKVQRCGLKDRSKPGQRVPAMEKVQAPIFLK